MKKLSFICLAVLLWYACTPAEQVTTPLLGHATTLDQTPVGDFPGRIPGADYYDTGEAVKYISSTKSKHPTLVVLGDGFINEDLMKNGGAFEIAAIQAIDTLFNTEPYKTYKDYFTVYFIAAESKERGADVFEKSDYKNTYFNCGWDTQQRNINCNSSLIYQFVNQFCFDITERITAASEVNILVIINDSRYAGQASYSTNSYRTLSLTAMTKNKKGGDVISWISNPTPEVDTVLGHWTSIAVHEFGGHGFGRLADEYFYTDDNGQPIDRWDEIVLADAINKAHNAYAPFGNNVSVRPNETAWWYDRWIAQPQPAPYDVGFWKGAWVNYNGAWRPEKNSIMDDNRRYFNAPSREIIVRRILSMAGETFDFQTFLSKDSHDDHTFRILEGTMPEPGNKGVQKAASASDNAYDILPRLAPPRLTLY